MTFCWGFFRTCKAFPHEYLCINLGDTRVQTPTSPTPPHKQQDPLLFNSVGASPSLTLIRFLTKELKPCTFGDLYFSSVGLNFLYGFYYWNLLHYSDCDWGDDCDSCVVKNRNGSDKSTDKSTSTVHTITIIAVQQIACVNTSFRRSLISRTGNKRRQWRDDSVDLFESDLCTSFVLKDSTSRIVL